MSSAGILVLMTEITRILSNIEQGDPQGAEQLLPLVYDEESLENKADTRRAAVADRVHIRVSPGYCTALAERALYLALVYPTGVRPAFLDECRYLPYARLF